MIINKSDIINQINQKIESLTTSDIDYSVKKVISYINIKKYTIENRIDKKPNMKHIVLFFNDNAINE